MFAGTNLQEKWESPTTLLSTKAYKFAKWTWTCAEKFEAFCRVLKSRPRNEGLVLAKKAKFTNLTQLHGQTMTDEDMIKLS
jgi:hypothetical protein